MSAEPPSATEFVPASRSLAKLRRAATECRGCPLWRNATQTVFGAGPRKAELMLVGEQPGDREDIEGEPFVGPAGSVLTRAVESAGIEPGEVYLTNAVKHFKWQARGKRRLHRTPRAGEVEACKPWLEAELEAVKPTILRLRDHDEREDALGAFVDDLRLVAASAAGQR